MKTWAVRTMLRPKTIRAALTGKQSFLAVLPVWIQWVYLHLLDDKSQATAAGSFNFVKNL